MVIAWRSRARPHGRAKSARRCGADYLLEGSVRRQGERVRITARLVETAGETHLWAETYERHLTDCLSVQADVASRIAESLTMELSPGEAAERPGAVTSVTAYQEYLQGRLLWNNWFGPDDERLDQALSRYTEALRIDSNFAPATLAWRVPTSRVRVNYRERPRGALETARAAAKRSIELDSRLSEGHLALADVRRMLEWDWRGAESRLHGGDCAQSEPGECAPRIRDDARCAWATRRGGARGRPRR